MKISISPVAAAILYFVASVALATNQSDPDATATATASHNGNTTSNSNSNAVAGGGNANATGINTNTNVNAPVANGGKADSTSVSGAISGSSSTVKNDNTDVNVNGQSQTAKGGNASQGQDQSQIGINEQGQSQSSKTSTSTVQGQGQVNGNSDNEQSTDVSVEGDTYQQVRQAPSIAQGSFAIQGCGAAGNVGGTNSHGAAFLGLGFTPAECYAFLLAQAYQAVGETQTACEVLNSTKAAKRAEKRGVKLADCTPVVVVEKEPLLQTRFVTQEELAEHEKRIIKSVVKK